MSTRLYVDSSAYLALVLRNPGFEKISDELDGQSLLSSVLLIAEVERCFMYLSRQGKLTSNEMLDMRARFAEDLEYFALRPVTLELASESVMPSVTTPRTLDLLHLRTALSFHRADPIRRFVSRDKQQITGARGLGLPV